MQSAIACFPARRSRLNGLRREVFCMRQAVRVLVLCFTCCTLFALGQDEPSLGDAARQARQRKQQKGAQVKDGQSKEAQATKPPKVVTNDEIPEHPQSSTSPDQPRE